LGLFLWSAPQGTSYENDGGSGRYRRRMARARLALWLGFALAMAFALALPGDARPRPAGAILAPCASTEGLLCGYVSVPLDYAHPKGRKLRLFVTAQAKQPKPRGTILLLAGGPGEASTTVFDLDSDLWRSLFPGYRVAAYDDRGTGDSAPLSCRGRATAEQCAAAIGPSRVFYGTRENIADMEAVRRALGVDRIGLFGLSYGTKQALAYTLAHPDNVERLLLDSVVPADGPEPLGLDSLRGISDALRSICHDGGCAAVTRDPAADFARLANRLAVRPLDARVPVYVSGGWAPTMRRVHIDGHALLRLAITSDLNSGLAVALPAAVRAALNGRPRQLEHLAALVGQQPNGQVNNAVLYATMCNDGPFPWDPQTPLASRRALLAAAVDAVAPTSLLGFGSWAAQGQAAECLAWPAGPAPASMGKLPDVPVLVLAGDRDVRTPWRDGVVAAARFRQGRVVVAPGVGHMAVSSSSCVNAAVRTWIVGRVPPARCERVPLTIRPLAPIPASVAAATPIGGVGGLAGRTLAATVATLREAEASWLTVYPAGWASGLGRGELVGEDFDAFRYSAYSDVRGLSISGRLTFSTSRFGTLVPGSERGIVSVGGNRAANGFLQVRNHRIFGILGGRNASAQF
jgi:pimeloyl-ACP methyl ester carboxylesterase